MVLGLVAPAQAPAASYRFDVPELLEKPIAAVKRITEVDLLVPSRLTAEHRRLYSSGRGRAASYEFQIGSVRDCRGAGACFVAAFHARRGAEPTNERRVRLTGGRQGHFKPLTCGASCAAPSLEWLQDGVLYTIEAKLGTKRTERSILIRLANSAIRAGPR